MKKQLFIILILLFAVMGCSYNVPLRHNLSIDNPPTPKYDKKLLIVMTKQEAQKIIKHSPQLGDTYVFKGGPALKGLLVDVLGQLYKEVSYAESREMAEDYDIAVEAELITHEIILNIYKGNTVNLGIDYALYDKKGKLLEKIPTKTSSRNRYSGGEMTQAFLLGSFNNIGRMKSKAGTAWDMATLNSIGELIDGLAKQK